MEKLKILVVTQEFPPFVGSGSGKYISNLVDDLIKLGHQITVITPQGKGAKDHEKKKNLEIIRVNILQSSTINKIIPNALDNRILLGMKMKKLIKTMDLSQYDLLHIVDSKSAHFITKDMGIPVIVGVNDYYAMETSINPFKFPYFSSDLLLRYFYYHYVKHKDKQQLKKASLVITNSQYTAKAIHRVCKVPKDQIRVIYRSIDLKKFYVAPSKDKYNNHSILFIGKNMERKGAKYVLLALPKVLLKYPDAKLTMIGQCTSFYKKTLKKIIKKYQLEKHVTLIDHVPPKEVPKILSKTNVFAFPPIIENLARVLYECMATKTPIVCTDVGANKEAVDSQVGIIVPTKDPHAIAQGILKIFKDPSYAKKLGETGHKRVKNKFNPKILIAKTLTAYKDAKRN